MENSNLGALNPEIAAKALQGILAKINVSLPDEDLDDSKLVSAFESAVAERIKTAAEEVKKTEFESGRKNGFAEAQRKLQAEIDALKSQKTDLEWDKNPLTLALQEERKREKEELLSKLEEEKAALIKAAESKVLAERVFKIVDKIGLKYNLGTTESKQEKAKSLFFQSISNRYQFERVGDNIVPVVDGKVAKDSLGNTLTAQALIEAEMDELFDKAESGQARAGANVSDPAPKKDMETLRKQWAEIKDPIARNEFAKKHFT